MRIFRSVLAVAVLSLAASAVPAQDSEEQTTETPSPEQEPAQQEPDSRTERAPADDVFIPTEELPVTEEVTFPVDI